MEGSGLVTTECNPTQLEFHALGRRDVIGRFDGGRITSDGGGLLLREVDQRLGVLPVPRLYAISPRSEGFEGDEVRAPSIDKRERTDHAHNRRH